MLSFGKMAQDFPHFHWPVILMVFPAACFEFLATVFNANTYQGSKIILMRPYFRCTLLIAMTELISSNQW